LAVKAGTSIDLPHCNLCLLLIPSKQVYFS
jgi:hypothetical protein